MNGDMPHDGGHGGGGHAVGDELKKTGRYGIMTIQTPTLYGHSVKKHNSEAPPSAECETKVITRNRIKLFFKNKINIKRIVNTHNGTHFL